MRGSFFYPYAKESNFFTVLLEVLLVKRSFFLYNVYIFFFQNFSSLEEKWGAENLNRNEDDVQGSVSYRNLVLQNNISKAYRY